MAFPVDVSYVRQAEEKLGVTFPAAYVVRICQQNGGNIPAVHDCWELFPVYDDTDKKRIRRTCNDVVRENSSANRWPGFPNHAVAIGSNGTGDKLVLIREPDTPTQLQHGVFWWDHETNELHHVANDMSELFDD